MVPPGTLLTPEASAPAAASTAAGTGAGPSASDSMQATAAAAAAVSLPPRVSAASAGREGSGRHASRGVTQSFRGQGALSAAPSVSAVSQPAHAAAPEELQSVHSKNSRADVAGLCGIRLPQRVEQVSVRRMYHFAVEVWSAPGNSVFRHTKVGRRGGCVRASVRSSREVAGVGGGNVPPRPLLRPLLPLLPFVLS